MNSQNQNRIPSWIADDISQLGFSAIKEMAMRAAKVPDACSLTWGLPSFRTPAPVREAIKYALEQDPDIGKYSLPQGLPELRAAAAEDFQSRSKVQIDPESRVLITAGNMEGVRSLLRTILDPDDEVIVTDPCFASHILQIKHCRGQPVFLLLDEKAGWQFDPDMISKLVSPRTKAILLVNPHNPTGTVFPKDFMEALGRAAEHHGILVMIDDPYSPFVYGDDPKRGDPAAIESYTDRLAYLFTFSKVYAMSGWRVGYMVVPAGMAEQVLKVHDATLICAPRISQVAALAALGDPALPPEEFRQTLDKRRKMIIQRLDRMPEQFSYVKPQGAYYIFPKIQGRLKESRAFALDLLQKARVAVTPGVAFGPSGEGHIRMAYCVDEATITEAFDRMEDHFREGAD